VVFSFSIYYEAMAEGSSEASVGAGEGRLVWQKYNCQSCHQLYGLGGFLGPDLSNVYSMNGKGADYISAVIRSGTAQMPAFDLTEQETKNLLEFMRAVDATGSADPRDFNSHFSGMISRK
jgi:nitric oxide reductase subunit C